MRREAVEVAIVGGGPAGLSAARSLAAAGLAPVVLEREAEAGGVPRHCGHIGFGMVDFHRVWTGPRYAAALRTATAGIDRRTGHVATMLAPGGVLEVSGPEGPYHLEAKRILLATGVREGTRAARLVSGSRPFGVMTTGALQRFVYLESLTPCRAPVIVGTELVAFSTLLTLRHVGVRPRLIVGEAAWSEAPWPAALGARLVFGVPVVHGTRVEAIRGGARVEGVTLVHADGRREEVACDAVVFTAGWVPEAALARAAGLPLTARGGPAVDKDFRTGDPAVFAAGNVLRGVRSSGGCALEGRAAARAILRDLSGASP
ncbi:NAD(P)/FAD-dependent oxidoreductase [Labrys wisconsinensis]|uniref:Thioredoxin reductase n=1 Tax=Labrys wisconsinensis TaxID=425677 RepID=A0ABU0JJY1_9HYPH|nr:FAD-dependent oxidoreductase [Labrys wisconsinensis]MDQ0473791.1 thioredoxin reductase [Labrys wisconsinensis]